MQGIWPETAWELFLRPTRRSIVTGLVLMPVAARAQGTSRVAAASDLRAVLDGIARDVAQRGKAEITVTFGASGNLSRQIEQGAPFELFLSADESYADRLVAAGMTDGPGAIYAVGRLALIAGKASRVGVDQELKGLADAAGKGEVARFAIANPEHAPYGVRAREVLERSVLWDKLRPRLVLGENVAQAAQFVASGAAEAGLIAAPLLANPDIANTVRSAMVSDTLHTPLRQRMVLMKGASAPARALYEAMLSPGVREVMTAAGFHLP